jgi:hypothetical protein
MLEPAKFACLPVRMGPGGIAAFEHDRWPTSALGTWR